MCGGHSSGLLAGHRGLPGPHPPLGGLFLVVTGDTEEPPSPQRRSLFVWAPRSYLPSQSLALLEVGQGPAGPGTLGRVPGLKPGGLPRAHGMDCYPPQAPLGSYSELPAPGRIVREGMSKQRQEVIF